MMVSKTAHPNMAYIRFLTFLFLVLFVSPSFLCAQDDSAQPTSEVNVQKITNQLQAEGLTPIDIVSQAKSMGLSYRNPLL